MATTKATFGLPTDAVDYLKTEAARRGISMADVLRQAISVDRYIREKSKGGADVLIAEEGKQPSKLLLTS